MRMIFNNLPVRSAEASKAFFAALGFPHNPEFSDERTTCIVISDAIFVMALEHDYFEEFLPEGVSRADPHAATGLLTALSCDSREEVDDLTARALAAGATRFRPTEDRGFMYSTSFRDPDGHVWELVWMDQSGGQD